MKWNNNNNKWLIDKEEVHPMNDWDVFIVWDVFIIGYESNHTINSRECVFGLIFKSIFLACVN